MTELPEKSHKLLMQLFGLASMQEMPTMSAHVRELIALLGNPHATAKDLTNTILKDYSLTVKVLQVVNSAYYMRSVPVTTISRAVTLIGFTTLRDLALGIALFEEFRKQGRETDKILELTTLNFVSATLGRLLTYARKFPLSPEEAFICTLLHNLGRMVVLVYLPDRYQTFEQFLDKGYSDERAARTSLNDLTFTEIGCELGRYWNFSDIILNCMDANPPRPSRPTDTALMLQNIAAFSNQLTTVLLKGSEIDLADLLYRYDGIFALSRDETRELMRRSIEAAEDTSAPIRQGLHLLRMREKLIPVLRDEKAEWRRDT